MTTTFTSGATMHVMTTQERMRKLVFGIEPGAVGSNNGDHNVAVEALARYWEEYHSVCSPSIDAIHATLGLQSLDPEMADEEIQVSRSPVNDIKTRGAGILDFITQNLIAQTHIDPRFAVLALEAMCNKHKLNNFRTPTGHGCDIVYSTSPLDDRYGFDNHLFIPARFGYYGIVGKAGAR